MITTAAAFNGYLAAALTISSAMIVPAHALQSEWAATAGGRMRLVIDPMPDGDGMVRGALQIALDEGWKTYWIEPGASGIPPQIDLSGSRNIELLSLRLPPPVRVDDGHSVWAGYVESVDFGLEFRTGGAGQLEAQVFIGICEKICVPFQANFSLTIPAPSEMNRTDPAVEDIIEQTFLSLPQAPSEDFSIVSIHRDESGAGFDAIVKLPEFRPDGNEPALFVAAPPGWTFAMPRLIADDGSRATFRVDILDQPKVKDGKPSLDLVVTLGDRAIEAHAPLD